MLQLIQKVFGALFIMFFMMVGAGAEDWTGQTRPAGDPSEWTRTATMYYCLEGGAGDVKLVPGTTSTFSRADIDCYEAINNHNLLGMEPNNSGAGESGQ